MVLTTASLPVSMTLTSPDDRLATYSLAPSSVSAQPVGSVPTVIALTTLRLSASITDTVPLMALVTYTFLSSGVIATQRGSSPTGTSASLRLRSLATSSSDTESLSGFTDQ